MVDDLALFGEDPAPARPPEAPAASPIADWQVDLLRKALDARGLESMPERQRAIEVAAGRATYSLRDLSHDEALQVLSRLGQVRPQANAQGSAWDQRGDDTWIDRL